MSKRKDPKLGLEDNRGSLAAGLIGLGVLVPLAVAAIHSELSGGISFGGLGALCVTLWNVFLFLGMLGLCCTAVAAGATTLVQRRRWRKAAITTRATIMDKRCIRSIDQYEIVTDCRHEFTVRVDDPRSASPGEGRRISMRVTKRVYDKHFVGKVVRAYYSAVDPLEIMIEGE